MDRRKEKETSTSMSAALMTTELAKSNENDRNMEEDFTLLMKKFRKFMKQNYIKDGSSSKRKSTPKKVKEDKPHAEDYSKDLCYSCREPGNFISDYPYPFS